MGPIGNYAGFSWTKTYVYQPNTAGPGVTDSLGYACASSSQHRVHRLPSGISPFAPLVATSLGGAVNFTSVFIVNPDVSDGDGSITVTITGYVGGPGGTPAASQSVGPLADASVTTVRPLELHRRRRRRLDDDRRRPRDVASPTACTSGSMI